ncbi:MAG: histone family protein [Archaeoglobaceae archaeon]
MAGIPTAPIDRLIRNAGAPRVSEAANKKMVDALEEYTEEVARKAVDIARHSGRKTVKVEDIKLALKQ